MRATAWSSGTAGAVLVAAYLLRAVGDIGDGTVSRFFRIGVVQTARPGGVLRLLWNEDRVGSEADI
jgi:hypothetical protein